MRRYQIDIGDISPAEYARAYALLSAEKRARIDRFRFPDDKKRSLAGELLARRAVAEECGAAEEEIVFASGANGKPYVLGLPAEFNVSHSGALVVCAADGPGRPLGIDVERIEPISLSVARRVCTAEELRALFGHAPAREEYVRTEDVELLRRFYALWTRKEAYVKCTGEGIARLDRPFTVPGAQTFYFGEYVISIYQEEGAVAK